MMEVLGAVSLSKTVDPEHMRSNAQLDFEIGEADMDALRALVATDHGESAAFPVYSGKERSAVTCASS